jgi:hypothetical protein
MNVLSRITSRHQVKAIIIISIRFQMKNLFMLKFNIIILEIIKLNVLNDIKIGQGLKFKIK